ncbi:MAG: YggT family protein [Bacilli bacterium]|nr:YggT family protein [Bacilli bacterium]
MTFSLIIYLLNLIFQAYGAIMTISIILSWIPGAFEIRFFRQVRKISDWYLESFRGKIVFGVIDFTPVIGLLIYSFIINLLSIWI